MAWASLIYAFTVGMVATVNPCGFAMLPLYVTWSVDSAEVHGLGTLRRAVETGVGASVGFVVVFGVLGVAVSAGLSVIMGAVPWVMVALGALFAVVGGAMAAGRSPTVVLPGQARLDAAVRHQRGWRRPVGFGVAYAVASLTCSLPVFLAGVAGAFTRAGVLTGVGAFLAYGLGMGVVFTALAVVVGLAGPGVLRRLRRWGPRLERAGGVVLALVGIYLVYYWVVDLLGTGGGSPLVRLVDRAQGAVAGATEAGGTRLGAALVLLVVVAALVAAWRQARRRAASPSPVAARTSAVLATSGSIPGDDRGTGSGPPAPSGNRALGPPRRRGRWRWPVGGGTVAAVLALGLSLAWPAPTGPQARATAASSPGQLQVTPSTRHLLALEPFSGRLVRPAPGFTLTDQHGKRVSLAGLRRQHKVVVLSFNDNHCHDVCPLYAQDVRAAVADLGTLANQVAFVAVNVNPFYPSPAANAAFDHREHLTGLSDWSFLTGPPSRLQRVWHDYGVAVVRRPHRTVQHATSFYLIGLQGKLRALGSFGSSSIKTGRWGHALASLSAQLLGIHKALPAQLTTAPSSGTTGRRAPDFSLPSLAHPGTSRVALARFSGRPLVINFFASWCSACRAEAPALERLAHRYAGRVTFIGVNVDDTPGPARRFLHTFGITYPVGADRQGTVAARYGVRTLPKTIIVSAAGRILHRDVGEVTVSRVGAQLARVTTTSPPG